MIELLLVIGMALLVSALTIPVGVRFLQTQSLNEARSDILTALRRARTQAVFQKNDSAFGVEFLPSSFVVFQGSSYALRTQSEDEIFSLTSGTTVSGIGEIVFTKRTGLPSVIGTITISSGSDSYIISVNSQGNIERI